MIEIGISSEGNQSTQPGEAYDWADSLPDTDHNRFFKTFDWSTTTLGPRTKWPLALRLYVQQLLADARPCSVLWGPDLTGIYNEAFIPLIGESHPAYMGNPHLEFFPDLKHDLTPMFEGMRTSKVATHLSDFALTLNRNGFREETYWTGVVNPLRDAEGAVGGFYNSVVEVTRQNISDRRRTMVNMISMFTEDPTLEKVWKHIIECLATNRLDIPVALLYEASVQNASDDLVLTLRGSLGLPEKHKFLVQKVTLGETNGLISLLSQARHKVITVEAEADWKDPDLTKFGEPPKHITAIPISNAGKLLGFLVMANNPRRPLDSDHEQFVMDISRQMSTTIASTLGLEDLRKRQIELQEQLAESERQIRYMAQHSDIGMQHLSLSGRLIWANGHYFTMVGLDEKDPTVRQRPFPLESELLDEDHAKARDAWDRIVHGQKTHTIELRLKRKYIPDNGDPVPATILLSSFPYRDHGKVQSVMACMTDVSRLKWAESWQARMAHEAQESKRQQGEYIDVISHEVRNPLSAILQLADSITDSPVPPNDGEPTLQDFKNIINENVEAARTILTCAQHQKRIVDDVLSLSKMNFELMTLTPTSINQKRLVDGAIRMLEADLASAQVQIHTKQDVSVNELCTDAVICDSLRVTQILINLLSNAIKFTKREARRDIIIRYGAALSEPRELFSSNIKWAAPKRRIEDITLNPSWGTGETLYLTFCIEDTGPGMTAEQLQRLFNRFEQATPRTSVKYGGSGLGLFISHTLVEKQTGSIGVSSEVGKGSVFAFFIKVRRAEESKNAPPGTSLTKTLNTEHAVDVTLQPLVSAAKVRDGPLVQATTKLGTVSSASTLAEPKIRLGATYHVLLVEDNLINQQVLKRQLIKAGCTVHVANHGQEALDFLRTTSHWKDNASSNNSSVNLDVVLMDWEMPVMDGLTCSKAIRSLEQSGQMKGRLEIIATTANVRQEQVELMMEAGADTVMPKPFKVADLLHLIQERLDLSQPPGDL